MMKSKRKNLSWGGARPGTGGARPNICAKYEELLSKVVFRLLPERWSGQGVSPLLHL